MNRNTNYIAAIFVSGLFASALFAAAPFAAFAQEYGDYSTGCCGDYITPSSVDTYTPYDSYITPSSVDTYTPYDSYITPSSVDTYTPYDSYITPSSVDTYSSYTPSYSYDTVTPFYSYDTVTPSYSYMPSYSAGAYYTPSYSYSYPYYTPSRSSSNTNTSVFSPTTIANNGNSCTAGNSCNTTISSPTTITTSGGGSYPVSYPSYYPSYNYTPTYYNNPAPTCYLSASQTSIASGQAVTLYWNATNATYGSINNLGSVSPSGSRIVYPYGNTTYVATFSGPGGSTNCYASVNVNAQTTPYVTLSQVPYTGLDLGPVGTAVYWLSLLLLCALAAYAVAVKKVHKGLMTRFMGGLQKFLLGDQSAVRHPAYRVQAAPAHAAPQHAAPAVEQDTTDAFIAGQIQRLAR